MQALRSLAKRRLWGIVTIVVLGLLILPAASDAATPLRQSISVSPSSGPPGTSVTVSGSGFTPGGYQGSLFWDGAFQKSFNIPAGGAFSTGFTVPAGAGAGFHTILVCSSFDGTCQGGEFAQQATTQFNVVIPSVVPPTATSVPTFNVQPAGIEVTQGIRQDFANRTPSGDLVLVPEDWVHVAGRRTIVRVYPWLIQGPPTQVTARLHGQRDGAELPGSPLSPVRANVIPRSGDTIDSMRRDTAKSWIFVLPESWTEAGSLSLTASVNPSGPAHVPECPGCSDDNTAYLSGVQFETLQEKNILIQVIRTDWYWRDASGAIVNDAAELEEIFNMLLYWEKVWPIDESRVRMRLRTFRISHGDADPPINDPPNWDNQLFHDTFGYLYAPPSGRNSRPAFSTDPYVYVPTTFDPDSAIIGCSGVAGIGYPPLFHTGACWAAAQEAGHSIGLNHASNAHGELGGGPVDPAYPGAHGEIEPDAFGFDIYSLQVVPPDDSCEGHTHGYMSYGCWTKWTSVYSWNKVVAAFQTENARASREAPSGSVQLVSRSLQPLSEAMRIGGQHKADGSISLSPIMRLTDDLPSYQEPDSEYELVVLDAAGDELFRGPFSAMPQTHTEEGEFSFYRLVPYFEGAASIILEKNGALIGSLMASDSAPTVAISEPAGSATWGQGEDFPVSWSGEDADGDTLYYRVELQAEGSEAWQPIYGDTTMQQVTLEPSLLPGYAGEWNLRVQVSDGFHTATDVVGPITIEPQLPQTYILQPFDGRLHAAGAPLNLRGDASDLEEGPLPEDSLVWYLDGEQVGTGLSLALPSVDQGEHEIRLEATNSAGLTGESTVMILVDRDSDGDGMTNGWEEQYGLAPLNPADGSVDSDDDGLTNYEEFNLGSDPTNANSDGDPASDLEEAAAGTDPNDPDSYPRHTHGPINPGGTLHEGEGHRLSTGGVELQPTEQEAPVEADPVAEAETSERPATVVRILYLAAIALVGLVVVGGLVFAVLRLRRRS